MEPYDPVKNLKKHHERLNEIIQVKEGHIVINVEYEYNIALHRCDTLEKILAWAYHLTEKTWMTQEILRHFIAVACNEHNLNLPQA